MVLRPPVFATFVSGVLLQLGMTGCGDTDASPHGSGGNVATTGEASGGSSSLGVNGGSTADGGRSQPIAGTAGAGGPRDNAGGSGGTPPAQGGVSSGGVSTGVGGGGSGGASGVNDVPAGPGTGGVQNQGGSGNPGDVGAGPPETGPQGYGQGTTGGGNEAPQRAASLSEIQALIDGYSGSGGLVIEYTGSFDFTTIPDPCRQHSLPSRTVEIKRKGDITLVGKDGSSANFGIHIASSARNVIVRNMTIGLTPGGGSSDIISIEGMSDGAPSNVWIDHNELFTSMAECDGAGDTEFDGMIDVKKGADAVTVSYNYLHDHHKVSLNGSSDSDTAVRHITFHHNLIEAVGSRVPLQRGGYSHLFSNHFVDVRVSGINVRMGGYALIESNYFERVKNPVTSRDSDEIGFWDLRNNNLATAADVAQGNGFGITWDSGNDGTVNATDWKTTKAFPQALGYSYVASPSECVRAGLRAVVGAGKGLKTLKCEGL